MHDDDLPSLPSSSLQQQQHSSSSSSLSIDAMAMPPLEPWPCSPRAVLVLASTSNAILSLERLEKKKAYYRCDRDGEEMHTCRFERMLCIGSGGTSTYHEYLVCADIDSFV